MSKQYFEEIRKELDGMNHRSAWDRGVNEYAHGFVDDMEEWLGGNYIELDDLRNPNRLEKILLNGADNWHHYSWAGFGLCYNGQIAERLATPSELKRTRNGYLRPNSREDWLDVQARALYQAFLRVKNAMRAVIWRRDHE